MALCCFVVIGANLTGLAQQSHRNWQNGPADAAARMRSWEHHVKLKDESVFKDLKWRQAGPAFQGGRIESITCPAGNTSTIYVGVGSGNLWKSDNNGITWKPIFENESTFAAGSVAVSESDPNIVWVGTGEVLMARSSYAGTGVFKSVDSGQTWQNMGLHDTYHIARVLIDPHDPDVVYVAAIGHNYSYNEQRGLFKTVDGGRTWEKDGQTWLRINNMPIAEVYAVEVDMADPYNIYIGTQDNAAIHGPSDYALTDTDPEPWKHIYLDRWGGGDSYFTLVDPTDRNIVYYEHQFGDLRRKNLKDGSAKSIGPRAPKGEPPLQRNWMTPVVVSHHNPFTLYYGANKLFKSINRGDNWTCISPDLTTSPGPEKQGDVPYGTITMICESPLKPGLIYVGTDDGNVQITRDDGINWTKISDELAAKWVSRIVASEHELGTVYVSFTGYREDDFEKYLYMSNDFGKTWEPIVGNLPCESINVVAEDHRDKDILYVGTDLGVYTSLDRGKTWISLCNSLPTTPVHDLVVHPRENELVIGTHGRSVYILDAEKIKSKSKHIGDKDYEN